MNLYDLIPEPFFLLLVSPNHDLYLDALFIVRDSYRKEDFIERGVLASRFLDCLQDGILHMVMEDQNDEDNYNKAKNNLSGLAHFLIRKLIQYGWIESEFHANSFEEYITVPDYSIKFLNLFYDFFLDKPKESNSLVRDIYASLKAADSERDEFMYDYLSDASKKTEELYDSLKSLLFHMRRFYQNLLKKTEVKEIAADHFDRFKTSIYDSKYHFLKTVDSVPRFRPRVLQILQSWQFDLGKNTQLPIIDYIAEQVMKKGISPNVREAKEITISMIVAIIDIFEKLDKLIGEIDKKISIYIKATNERMQYLINTDRNIKGKIITIIKNLPRLKSQQESEILEHLVSGMNITDIGFINESSLYHEPTRRLKHKSDPLQINDNEDDTELYKETEDLKTLFRRGFSHQKIVQFIMEQIAEKERINSNELHLQFTDDFIRLMLAVIKSDEKNIPYTIDFKDGYIVINGTKIPDMTFLKRGR